MGYQRHTKAPNRIVVYTFQWVFINCNSNNIYAGIEKMCSTLYWKLQLKKHSINIYLVNSELLSFSWNLFISCWSCWWNWFVITSSLNRSVKIEMMNLNKFQIDLNKKSYKNYINNLMCINYQHAKRDTRSFERNNYFSVGKSFFHPDGHMVL